MYHKKAHSLSIENLNTPKASQSLDRFENIAQSDIDSIAFDEEEESVNQDISKKASKSSSSKKAKIEDLDEEILKKTGSTKKSGNSSLFKKLKVYDIKDIARTLKAKSISAKTIIQETNRIVTYENNSTVNGTTLVKALGDKLTKNTKSKILKHVELLSVSDNVIRVKLKDVSNIKLTFKTDQGRKTIKVYDNATIKINNHSSKVTAVATGFSYHYLGLYWKVKEVIVQQTSKKGTLDIALKGKLKNVNLPTITLGNLHRKMY